MQNQTQPNTYVFTDGWGGIISKGDVVIDNDIHGEDPLVQMSFVNRWYAPICMPRIEFEKITKRVTFELKLIEE